MYPLFTLVLNIPNLSKGWVPQLTNGASGKSKRKKQLRTMVTIVLEIFEKERETVNLLWSITLGLSPAILLVTWPYFRDC